MHPHNRNDSIKARQLTNPADGAECHGQEWPKMEDVALVFETQYAGSRSLRFRFGNLKGLEQRYDASKSRLAR